MSCRPEYRVYCYDLSGSVSRTLGILNIELAYPLNLWSADEWLLWKPHPRLWGVQQKIECPTDPIERACALDCCAPAWLGLRRSQFIISSWEGHTTTTFHGIDNDDNDDEVGVLCCGDGQRPHRRQPVTFLNYWLLLHEHRTGRRRRQWPGECLMIRINIDTQRESPKLCHFRKGDNLWMTVKWPGNATSSCPDFKASSRTNNLVLIQRVAVINFWRLFK